MEFGTFTNCFVREGRPEHDAFEEWVDMAQMADDLGVDCFWIAELHFRPHTPLSSPLIIRKQRRGPHPTDKGRHRRVALLPLANPAALGGRQCSTLDHLSEAAGWCTASGEQLVRRRLSGLRRGLRRKQADVLRGAGGHPARLG